MMLRAAVAAAVLVSARPAPAQFEGVADLRMSAQQNGHKTAGKGKLFLSSSAWRMEMEMAMPEGQVAKAPGAPRDYRMVMFGKMATPRKSWMLNDRTKTYAVIEDDEDDDAEKEQADDWKVTRLGQDRVAGFSCTNVRAQRAGEDETLEACLAKDFISGAWLKGVRADKEWWFGGAKRAGVEGYPVRMIARAKDGTEKHRFEIVKVERRKVPASLFEVPAGYKQGGMMDVMAQTPEQQQQMQEAQRRAAEAMKNMSPEQKKMMEEMMKKYGGGQRQ
jgi:hypothetical protein